MTFSIIIPVYNVEKYIRECLDSIVKQSFTDYEVILVDDGSTDSSGAICDEYAAKYDSISVIHQENGGAASARNEGIKAAKGEWIWFVDSDDFISEDALKVLDFAFSKYKADMYCFNACKVFEQSDKREKLLFSCENFNVDVSSDEKKLSFFCEELLDYKRGWEVWLRIYKRDIIFGEKLAFANMSEVFAEDLDFTLRYLLYADRIYYICDILYFYRQVGTSLVHSYDENTVIPRLENLALNVYDEIKKIRSKYLRKNFYRIYYNLVNHHIQYKVPSLSNEAVVCQINSSKTAKKWLKTAEKNRRLLSPDMTNRHWF